MVKSRRHIFLLNGTQANWETGKRISVWGLPLHGRKWTDVLAELQQAGFIAGAEVLGIVGPRAYLRAVVGSDRGVYRDDTSAPWGMDARGDTYPVRIELTRIQEINRPWYLQSQGEGFRAVLEDRYFTERSLYVFRPGVETDRDIDWQVVFGDSTYAPETSQPPLHTRTSDVRDPEALEDYTADLFANIGFRVEQLGHRRPHERVPDGIAYLPKSLAQYLQRINEKPYFILWDAKFDCGPHGLTADEELAVREYVTDFAKQAKLAATIPEFWFVLVARTPEVGRRIKAGIDRASWPDGLREIGCRGLRATSLEWLRSVAVKSWEDRRAGNDPDHFLGHEMSRMLKTLNS